MLLILLGILVTVVAIVCTVLAPKKTRARTDYTHDVIVVGCSIAGPCVAKALSAQGRKVLMVERALWEKPDRIVGELLQPGGINALEKVGMAECALDIGMECTGYVAQDDSREWISLPFKDGFRGFSFHFGDFVQKLRRNVWDTARANVEMVEGTVTDLLTEEIEGETRCYGVQYTRVVAAKAPEDPFTEGPKGVAPVPTDDRKKTVTAMAPLVVMCDGGSSKFKSRVGHYRPAAKIHSHFVGVILKASEMPHETRGHVFLGKRGPILAYRLDPNEVRLLVDYPGHHLPPPPEVQNWLTTEIAPQMSKSMGDALVEAAKDGKNIRSMPIACYHSTSPMLKGAIAIGDCGNQRHPLTGGGMTVAFRDAILLADELAAIEKLRAPASAEMLTIEQQLHAATLRYSRTRYFHSSCINILSWALYAVFSGPASMRKACIDYFQLGGDAVSGPMALLSGLNPSPSTLLSHYVRVMFNGAYNLMTLSGSYAGKKADGTPRVLSGEQRTANTKAFFLSPERMGKAFWLLCYATYVFAPLAFMELLSMWRVLDPTAIFATRVYKPAESAFIAIFRSAGKPIAR